MFERFTERARQIVVLAQDEARQLKHNYIGTEHLLLGILREKDGLGYRILDDLGVREDQVKAWIREKVGEGDDVMTGQIPFTPRAKKTLELALREALSLGHNYIGTEHVLMGLIREAEGLHYDYLVSMGLDAEMIRNEVLRALSGPRKRMQTDPAHQVRIGIRSIRLGLKQISRGLDTLEAALEEQLPRDPDENT